MNYITMTVAVVGVITNSLLLSHYDDHPAEYLLRVYTILFCVMVAITECEWKRWFRVFGVFAYWTGRGAFMGLVALLTYHLPHEAEGGGEAAGGDGADGSGMGGDGVIAGAAAAAAEAVALAKPWLRQLRLGAAYGLGALGAFYFALGLLCFRRLKDAQLRKIKERGRMKVEMEELYERKAEIERLMNETETKLDRL